MGIADFIIVVQDYYAKNGRQMDWRNASLEGIFDPYRIMVSEIMLQQTQVSRVVDKYQQFIALFPTIQCLAEAPLGDVLRVWQGLGYNRRAKFLWLTAQQVVASHGGVMPNNTRILMTLPGIGVNTAGAIGAYAYDQPVVFIETNIRTVLIHHFFTDQQDVSDKQLVPILEHCIAALQAQEVSSVYREWYWGLMDYGVYLKRTVGNKSQRSATYVKQSAFVGSRRQIRGAVLRTLAGSSATVDDLAVVVADIRLTSVLNDLTSEQLIRYSDNYYSLS